MLFLFLHFPVANATCPSDIQLSGQLTCSSTVSDVIDYTDPSMLGGLCDDGECYTCGDPWPNESQRAAEHVYSFSCQQTGDVLMRISNLPCDLDMYVLDDSCDPNTGCLFGSTASYNADDEVTFSCVPGQNYYIVIEAYGTNPDHNASGPCVDNNGAIYNPNYTLYFDVSESTGCAENCLDGIDNDLDNTTDCDDSDCWTEPACCDVDGDGHFSMDCLGFDCDDNDASVYPYADEGINGNGDGKDNDCDGIIDEGTNDFDDDGDGYTENDGDCDDNAPDVNPDGTEIAGNDIDENCDDCIESTEIEDGIDNDCDGLVDEDDSAESYSDDTAAAIDGKEEAANDGCNCSSTSLSPQGALGLLALMGLVGLRRKD